MQKKTVELRPLRAAPLLVALIMAGPFACAETMSAGVAVESDAGARGPFGPSVEADASTEASPPPSDVLMCPVTTCSAPWATCPTSEFPCDANLLTDDDNCGGCGVRCGGQRANFSVWSCVDGQCTFGCVGDFRSCDKDPTNGCEIDTSSDVENCGDCGLKCKSDERCEKGTCIGPCNDPGAQDYCNGACTNLQNDDRNCGVCGNICDPTGPGKPALHSSMFYGCGGGKCGVPKCRDQHQRNCNNDLSDGCEANVLTTERCGSCDSGCGAGKLCASMNNTYYCLCADGYELCTSPNLGRTCERLTDDPENCGGCGHVCPGKKWPHFVPTCNFGVCGGTCQAGYADCDQLSDNGCEVNTRVDNRNCGACGNACSPGQVCSEGQCLVAPCKPGELPK